MHDRHHTRALDLMMELLPQFPPVIALIAKHDKNLASQARRSLESVFSNLAEADGVTRGHRKERIETAYGSLRELRIQLKFAAAFRLIPQRTVAKLDRGLDRASAMVWRRMHSPR